ncbi:MAG: hypothetical protein ABSE28_18515 [Candidatus Sulfotelmatobacter sp.]
MKRCLGFAIILLLLGAPALLAQDHVEIGAFADYFCLDTTPLENFAGIGGRAAVGSRPTIQLEAEMAYDFQRSYTQTYSNGISTELVNTKLRTRSGFFGPKFQTGSEPFRAFVTGKVGFENFGVTNNTATARGVPRRRL